MVKEYLAILDNTALWHGDRDHSEFVSPSDPQPIGMI